VSHESLQSEDVGRIASLFAIAGDFEGAEEVTTGLINATWIATFREDLACRRYLLQRINEEVFGNAEDVMANVERVTRHINEKVMRDKKDAAGQTLSLYPSREGHPFVRGPGGGIWRCYNFIEGCRTYDVVENERQAYQAGHAFGAFQNLVSDLPTSDLREVIPNFHHTPHRYQQLQQTVREDVAGRVAEVGEELDRIEAMAPEMDRIVDLAGTREVPWRVTHNDTKINNVLFDQASDEAVCVIDLDTVMPGLSLYDFGDLVRTATNPAAEDERDLGKVEMRLPIFRALVEGYLDAAEEFLTEREIELLPFSGKLIALELAMRFLADDLAGDRYFRTSYERQNRDRARTQLLLAERIGESEGELAEIVAGARRARKA
jgi:Ser/Thr protein kinase RdoA (MazF antagonist)